MSLFAMNLKHHGSDIGFLYSNIKMTNWFLYPNCAIIHGLQLKSICKVFAESCAGGNTKTSWPHHVNRAKSHFSPHLPKVQC